ncbi:uncharacterized protein LOC109397976 [Aedes albopictus]|uniref:C-type lectin domain-containing protein n=1 Tax=Aedes albopictus TaxID=7160 RepID=A0ABM2A3K1_AEDAL
MSKLLIIFSTIVVLCHGSRESEESHAWSHESHESEKDDDKRYTLYCPNNKPNFFSAFRLCMDSYQVLATDESREDSKKLAKLLADKNVRQPVWLSGTDLGQPGSWIWLSIMLPVGGVSNYVRWDDNVHNPSGCMTAELDDNHIKWSPKPCSQTACYVCQSFG